MGRGQHHQRRLTRFESFLPTRGAQAPAISRFETRKAVLRSRRAEVVAAGLRKTQEVGGHHHAYGVGADIFVAGIAAAISEKSGHGLVAASRQLRAQDVTGLSLVAHNAQATTLAMLAVLVGCRPGVAVKIRGSGGADLLGRAATEAVDVVGGAAVIGVAVGTEQVRATVEPERAAAQAALIFGSGACLAAVFPLPDVAAHIE